MLYLHTQSLLQGKMVPNVNLINRQNCKRWRNIRLRGFVSAERKGCFIQNKFLILLKTLTSDKQVRKSNNCQYSQNSILFYLYLVCVFFFLFYFFKDFQILIFQLSFHKLKRISFAMFRASCDLRSHEYFLAVK